MTQERPPISEKFNDPTRLKFLDILEAQPWNADAISDGLQVKTYGELLDEVSVRRHQLLKSWSHRDIPFLPLLAERDLDSHLNVLTCLCFEIPFVLIDPKTPEGRFQQILTLLRSSASRGTTSIHRSSNYQKAPGEQGIDTTIGASFVITSSGSTGVPKLIEISFRTHFNRMSLEFDLRHRKDRSVSALLQPPTSVGGLNALSRMIFGDLVYIFDPNTQPLGQILRRIDYVGITYLRISSQMARVIASYPNSAGIQFPKVEVLKIGGETVYFETLRLLRRYFDEGAEFAHTIGATEALTLFENKFLLSEAAHRSGPVPLGALTEGVVLQPARDFGPLVHEVVSSNFLAERYIGQPNLTARHFYIDDSGVRWWRSGDLVSKDASGDLTYVGRSDDVVKVNGMVAAPLETSMVISSWPGVAQAITIPHTVSGRTILVSHVEPQDFEEFDLGRLRKFLQSKLPSHLRPSEIKVHLRLPSNESGKIDRRALSDSWVAGDLPNE